MELEKFASQTVLVLTLLIVHQELIFLVKGTTKIRRVALQDFTIVFWAKIPTSGASLAATINCKSNQSIQFKFTCNQYETNIKMSYDIGYIVAVKRDNTDLKAASLLTWQHVTIYSNSTTVYSDGFYQFVSDSQNTARKLNLLDNKYCSLKLSSNMHLRNFKIFDGLMKIMKFSVK